MERCGVAWDAAKEAQRIACLPPEELEAFCARAREDEAGQLPTFAELLREARPWWYQESRRAKHRDIVGSPTKSLRAREKEPKLLGSFQTVIDRLHLTWPTDEIC